MFLVLGAQESPARFGRAEFNLPGYPQSDTVAATLEFTKSTI